MSAQHDVASAAITIRAFLGAGDRHSALREFIQLSDNLSTASHANLIEREPTSTGEDVWDAALAALVEHYATSAPDWARQRHLSTPQSLDVDPADPLPERHDVPDAFLRHGVLVWRDTLASV